MECATRLTVWLASTREINTGDERVDAALEFARTIVEDRGHISAVQFDAVRQAGYP